MSLVIDQLTKLNTRVAQLLAGVQFSKKLLDSVAPTAVQVAQDAAQVALDRQRSHEDRLVVELAEEVVVASTAVAVEAGKAAFNAAELAGDISIFDKFEDASAKLNVIPNNQIIRILTDGNYNNRQTFYRKENGILVFKAYDYNRSIAATTEEVNAETNSQNFLTPKYIKNIKAYWPIVSIEDFKFGGKAGQDIAQALKLAHEALPDTGGTIHFPNYGYKLNSLVILKGKSVRLSGPGSVACTIKMTKAEAGIRFEGTNVRHLFEVSDMAFGAYAASTGNALEATWTVANGNDAQFIGRNVHFYRDADGSFFKRGLKLYNCRNPKIAVFQMAGGGTTSDSCLFEFDGVTTDASITDVMTAHVGFPVKVKGACEGITIINSCFINCDTGVDANFTASKPYIALTAVNINARSRCVSAYNVKQLKIASCLFYANTLVSDQPGWEGVYIDGSGGSSGAQTSSVKDTLFFAQSYTGPKRGIVVENARYIRSEGNTFYDLNAGVELRTNSLQCRSDNDEFKFCTVEYLDLGTSNIRTGISDAATRAFRISDRTQSRLLLENSGGSENNKLFALTSGLDRFRISLLNDNLSNRAILFGALVDRVAIGGDPGAEPLRVTPGSFATRVHIQGSDATGTPSILSNGGTNTDLEVGGFGRGCLKTPSSAWNGPHLKMGDYHFWVDAQGKLRIKNGLPTSDVDGVLSSA